MRRHETGSGLAEGTAAAGSKGGGERGRAEGMAIPRHSAFEIAPMLAFAAAPELAATFDLTPERLEDPEAMVRLPVLHTLLEALVEVTGDPYFGLHFGASVDTPMFKRRVGALGLMLLSSPSMAVGLDAIVRYQNMFNEGDRYTIVERDGATHIRFEAWGPERLGQIQMAEKTTAQILSILALASPAIEPRAIRFAHSARAGSEAITTALGLEPTFDADCTAVVVETADLQRAIRGGDPDLFRFFDRHLTERADRASDASVRPDTLAPRVTGAVRDSLQFGQCSSQSIAQKLGLSLRSMQRQLAVEGTSLSAIVEDARRIRAQNLLATAMPVGEVAILLGYAGTPPFVRAFKRWFGTTATEWRSGVRTQR